MQRPGHSVNLVQLLEDINLTVNLCRRTHTPPDRFSTFEELHPWLDLVSLIDPWGVGELRRDLPLASSTAFTNGECYH